MNDGWMMMMNMGKLIGWLFSRQSVGICCLRKKTDGSFFFNQRYHRQRKKRSKSIREERFCRVEGHDETKRPQH